jgi:hypothetical protein
VAKPEKASAAAEVKPKAASDRSVRKTASTSGSKPATAGVTWTEKAVLYQLVPIL